jgi:hypothetical protein
MSIEIVYMLVVCKFPIISSTSMASMRTCDVEAALVTPNGGSESLFGDRTSKSIIMFKVLLLLVDVTDRKLIKHSFFIRC